MSRINKLPWKRVAKYPGEIGFKFTKRIRPHMKTAVWFNDDMMDILVQCNEPENQTFENWNRFTDMFWMNPYIRAELENRRKDKTLSDFVFMIHFMNLLEYVDLPDRFRYLTYFLSYASSYQYMFIREFEGKWQNLEGWKEGATTRINRLDKKRESATKKQAQKIDQQIQNIMNTSVNKWEKLLSWTLKQLDDQARYRMQNMSSVHDEGTAEHYLQYRFDKFGY